VATLHGQLEEYVKFVRAEVLPKAREDFRLPASCTSSSCARSAWTSAERSSRNARTADFVQIQGEMQKVAARVAQGARAGQPGLPRGDQGAEEEPDPDDQVLDFYNRRLAQIERIIRDQRLVTCLRGRPGSGWALRPKMRSSPPRTCRLRG